MGRAENWRQCGEELLDRGFVVEADGLAADGLAKFPDDGPLWKLRGLIRFRTGDIDGACEFLETAGALVPLDAEARCCLAECHARRGRPELARDLYLGLAADPSCPTAFLSMVASGLGALGEDQEALEVCRELTRRDPERHEALFGQAFYLRRLNVSAEVILPLVAGAFQLAPQSTLYRVTLASLLDYFGQRDEAVELLQGLDASAIECSCCLRRMVGILTRAPMPRSESRIRTN